MYWQGSTTSLRLLFRVAALVCSTSTADAAENADRPFSVAWKPPLIAEHLQAVRFADWKNAWAVGAHGTIWVTQDAGTLWQRQDSGTDQDLHSVHFIDLHTGWAAGDNGTILETRDGGRHWLRNTSGAEDDLRGVHFVDANRGWVVGSNGTILATADGGKHWRHQDSGTESDLRDVRFANAKTGWVVGLDGAILWTRDAGEHWLSQTFDTELNLNSVRTVDDNNVYIAGESGILFTHDGGRHWVHQDRDAEKAIFSLAFRDQHTVFAVGSTGTILTIREGGAFGENQDSGTSQDLHSVDFANSRTGAAVGDDGTILTTNDGGDNWQHRGNVIGNDLFSLYLATATTGWIVGDEGTILITRDAGEHWQPQTSGIEKALFAVRFTGPRNGWALGEDGTILNTTDTGEHWHCRRIGTQSLRAIQFAENKSGWIVGDVGTILRTQDGGNQWQAMASGTRKTLNAVHFLNQETGWVVGDKGTILVTHDGGNQWLLQGSTVTKNDLTDVHFANLQAGFVVGGKGTILTTKDGGIHWLSHPINTQSNLSRIYFANATTGWIAGSAGTILATRDGGEHWLELSPATDKSPDVERTLWDLHVADPHFAWAVGEAGTLLHAGTPVYGPWIEEREVEMTNEGFGAVGLCFIVHSDRQQPPLLAQVSYKTGNKTWENLEPILSKPGPNGRWRFSWKPAAFGLATNQEIDYRVQLLDNGPPLAPFHLGRFVYEPWLGKVLKDHPTAIGLVSAFIAVLLSYLTAFGAIFFFAPARLAHLGSRGAGLGGGRLSGEPQDGQPVGASKGGPYAALIALAQRIATVLVLPWLVRRQRVRREWTSLYNAGERKIDDLSRVARESFLQQPDFLDEWVAHHVDAVLAALDHLDLFRQRRVYVALPIRVQDAASGKMIDQPSGSTLQSLFATSRVVIPIVGGPGTGKSTLACALARWAIATRKEERLTPHLMLPVFIVEDTDNLEHAVARNLRRMIGDEPLPQDLLRSLLRSRRLMVIVDALSEREEATQRHVEALYGEDSPVNALIITSRRDPALGVVPRTALYPERLIAERLIPFIFEYLRRRQLDDRFNENQQIELGKRVLALARAGDGPTTVTPLMVTLFIESAISRIFQRSSLEDMPNQVPEVFVDYIRRLNPATGNPEELVDQGELVLVARSLAVASLGKSLVPSDFGLEDGQLAAAERVSRERAGRLVGHMIAIGVLERREYAGIPLLRFALDPVADYLAAIEKIDRLRSDREAWLGFLKSVPDTPGYPQQCDGFLIALSTCFRAYREVLELPSLTFDWEKTLSLAV